MWKHRAWYYVSWIPGGGRVEPSPALIRKDVICICSYFILVLAFWEKRIHEQLMSFERAESYGVFLGHIFTWGGGKKTDLCIAAWASGCRWQMLQQEILQRVIKILKQCIFLNSPSAVWLMKRVWREKARVYQVDVLTPIFSLCPDEDVTGFPMSSSSSYNLQ